MFISIIGLIVALVLLTTWFINTPPFGQNPSGKRLEKILQSPHYQGGKFSNIHFTPDLSAEASYWKILKAYTQTVIDKEPATSIPSIKTDLKNLPSNTSTLVWFGHSSYLLKIDNKHILVDPVFSGQASPVSFFGKNYEGTNVYGVDDLPEIDLLIISHDHYDHLDYQTITQLRPKIKQVVTSLGVGAHLEHWGYEPQKIQELDWWEKTTINSSFHLTATPARHFSGRGFKRNQTFWSSFVLETPSLRLFLGGDSGYDTHFKEIGQKFGGFDLAILENGQYNAYWHEIHTYPEETAQAAIDLRAKTLLPVHWAKFTLALHAWYEPMERLEQAAQKQGLLLAMPKIGQVVTIGRGYPQEHWWRTVK